MIHGFQKQKHGKVQRVKKIKWAGGGQLGPETFKT